MGKLIDLTGQTFGRLEVIKRVGSDSHKNALWECHCICGNNVSVPSTSLNSGRTRSCGCYKIEQISKKNTKNIKSMRFGKLLVIDKTDIKYRGNYFWKCLCDCGNILLIRSGSLLSGNTKSCGCSRLDYIKDNCVKWLKPGEVFGRLTVIGCIGKRNKRYLYLCKCICGNEKVVKAVSLRTGETTSCGCYNRDRIREACTTHGMSETLEYNRMKSHKRRELKRSIDFEWTVEMEQDLKNFFTSCVICNSTEKLCTDHVKPLSKGYGLRPGNAVRLCSRCNSIKWAHDLTHIPELHRYLILKEAAKFKLYWEGIHQNELESIKTIPPLTQNSCT